MLETSYGETVEANVHSSKSKPKMKENIKYIYIYSCFRQPENRKIYIFLRAKLILLYVQLNK